MKFEHIGHSYIQYAENVARMFFRDGTDVLVHTELVRGDDTTRLSASVFHDGRNEMADIIVNNDSASYIKDCKHNLGVCVFNACRAVTGKELPFGHLCGVRPAKIATDILLSGGSEEDAYRHYVDDLRVFPEKARSCVTVASEQIPILSRDYEKRCNLYVSIPFCPSRCNYCSFVSHSIERAGKLVEPYLAILIDEIKSTAKLIQSAGLTNDTVYIGGGTPGILSEEQIKRLCGVINEYFDGYSEFTYEFGRADVATAEKFAALIGAGVTRICVNPQILSDAVLEKNGRRHTVTQFYEAFEAARIAGFDNINCDVIAGLPYSTEELFADTVGRLIKLGADDITMHTLALKRSSGYYEDSLVIDDGLAERSFNAAESLLHEAGYREYYMYRQKRAGGNLENKGYALPGKKSVYNILMMSDAATVISVGAGGITKLVADGGKTIKRVCNYKYPYEYIEKPDKITDNLSFIKEFYKARGGE
ncbi:MAG: coproporphyrinogen dehydrogenase HemZ [Lachnospiraceae bacterium]|nr:coproporphyrinogen dehydrogenase HemZ [Lachnospiraceae bacterium]